MKKFVILHFVYTRDNSKIECVRVKHFPCNCPIYFNDKFLYVADKKRMSKCYHIVKGSTYNCVIVYRNSKCFTKSYRHLNWEEDVVVFLLQINFLVHAFGRLFTRFKIMYWLIVTVVTVAMTTLIITLSNRSIAIQYMNRKQ